MTYETKDSGERVEFETGSRRDTEVGKPRYDLIGKHGLLAMAKYLEGGEFEAAESVRETCKELAEGVELDKMDKKYLEMFVRLADLLERGAKKYGEHNWSKGQPTSRSF
jgi:hypothetical protein